MPSAESLSLAGSPTGTLTQSWLHLTSGHVFLLPVIASLLPDSPGLRWAMRGSMETWGLQGPHVLAVGGGMCCYRTLSALSYMGQALLRRVSPAGRRLEGDCSLST